MVLISRGLAAQYFQEVLCTQDDSHQRDGRRHRENKKVPKHTHISKLHIKILSLVQSDK